MIHVVTAENRHLYRHALMEMHRQRRALFIDQLHWGLEAVDGLEIDQFDAEDVTYLLDADHTARAVSASVRLLPTDRPHLLSEVFSYLCPEGVPRSPRIWEVTRFCPSPDTPKGAPRRRALAQMIAGIMETALLFGVEQVTFVAGAALARHALQMGWEARPLGPTLRHGRDRITAIAAVIDAAGLRRVRLKQGLGEAPLVRFASGERRAA